MVVYFCIYLVIYVFFIIFFFDEDYFLVVVCILKYKLDLEGLMGWLNFERFMFGFVFGGMFFVLMGICYCFYGMEFL